MYLPSMAYPLSSGFVQENKLNKVDCQLKTVLLPKLAYSRTSPLSVLFGPTPLGGISLRQHSTEQGLLQIKLFLKHWRTPHIAGQLLRIAVSWAQLVSGVGQSILVDTSRPLPQLQLLRWLLSLRQFLQATNATITVDHDCVIPIQRQNDIHLIDFFTSQPIFSQSHLTSLNACRLYLKVLLLSDIDSLWFRDRRPMF
jgi:hypothetical protein